MIPFAKSKSRLRKIKISTFDSETDGLGGELICITLYSPEHSSEPVLLSGENMVNEFLDICESIGGEWYAHNLSYDLRRIIDTMIDRYLDDLSIKMRTSSDAYGVDVTKQFKLRDSFALFPESLKSFTKIFSPEYTKLEIDDVAHFDLNNPAHREYALMDAKALYFALTNYFALLEERFSIRPAGTIAGTAVKAWEATLDEGEIYYPSTGKEYIKFVRSAYYGGLTGLTTTNEIHNCSTYDINSSYPAVMEQFGVPYGQHYIAKSIEHINQDTPGFVDITIHAPLDIIVPILPCRGDKGQMQWRRGDFRTVVSIPELFFALQHGYEIIKFHSAMVYKSLVRPFHAIVDKCRSLRYEFKGTAIEKAAKLIQNSLYGKFGTREERIQFKVIGDGDSVLGLTPTELSDRVYSFLERNDETRAIPEWAAWITAQARLKLLAAIYEVGPENVVYFDTDSITTTVEFPANLIDEKEYGKFKLEKTWSVFKAVAPKVYAGQIVGQGPAIKAKGLPFSRVAADAGKYARMLMQGEQISLQYQSISSLAVYIKTGKNQTYTDRRISNLANSTNWIVDDLGRVRAKCASII